MIRHYRVCSQCNHDAPTVGGVEMRGRWHCARCWSLFAALGGEMVQEGV